MDLIEENGPENVDIDADGIPFYEDNCPNIFNDSQLDDDGDGIGDACDNCRFDWNPTQRDLDSDGSGPASSPGDACDPNMDGDSEGDTDNDGDGILDDFDCFPEHRLLNFDRDNDGICDDRVLAADQAECTGVCEKLFYGFGYLTQSELITCNRLCDPDDSFHLLDNCMDAGDPQCQSACTDTDDLACRLARDACKNLYYNPGQEDTDGDLTGDQCDDEMMISELAVIKSDGPTISGRHQMMSQCFDPRINVSFRALGPPGVLPLPMTIGACSCLVSSWDPSCDNPCPPTDAHPVGNNDYAWDAIHSTTGSSYDNWVPGTDYTADGQDDNGYFADKSITFTRSRADNLVVSSWSWTAHRESDFDPNSPSHYDFSISKSITQKSLRLRVEFPPTPPGQPVVHGNVSGGWSVLTETFDAAEMVGGTGCVTIYIPPKEVSPLRLVFWGPYRFQGDYWTPYDPYLLRKPTAYLFFQEPLTGDQVMVTHRTRTMTPSQIGKIQLADLADPGPSLETAAVAVAEVDTAAMELGEGLEVALFAYSTRLSEPLEGGGAEAQQSPATLHLGLVGRPDNPWYRYEDVFPTGQEVPRLLGASLTHSRTEQRLLMLGARGTIEGLREHSLVALNLASGYFEDRGSLRLPAGLTGYSTVLDEAHARMIIFGGEIRGAPDKRVFLYYLRRRKLRQLLDAAPAGVARAEAALAVDAEGNRLFVFGGRQGEQAVGDAWALNLVSAQWSFLGDGTTEGPGAVGRAEALYDEVGKRLWVGARRPVSAKVESRLWTLGTRSGAWSEQVVLSAPSEKPGEYQGAVRDGEPQELFFAVPDTVSLPGQPHLVRLSASGPGLRLSVHDRYGARINAGRSQDATQLVAFVGLPGEEYVIRVAPGAGYQVDEPIGFQVAVQEAVLSPAGSYLGNHDVRALALVGRTAVLGCSNGLDTIDLSDVSAPSRLAHRGFGAHVTGLATHGLRAVLTRSRHLGGLKVVEVEDDGQLTLSGKAFSLGLARNVSTWQSQAYVAAGLFGVEVYRISGDGEPTLDDTYGMGDLVTDVRVHDGLLYVALSSGTVQILRLRASGSPEWVGETPPASGLPVRTWVVGDTLHVGVATTLGKRLQCLLAVSCSELDEVVVLDIGDRGAPQVVGSYVPGADPWIAASGLGRSLVVRQPDGLAVFQALPAPPAGP
jgi:hypothetical protein